LPGRAELLLNAVRGRAGALGNALKLLVDVRGGLADGPVGCVEALAELLGVAD
jgi:hypothetical protein